MKITEDHMIWFLIFLSAFLFLAILFGDSAKIAYDYGTNYLRNRNKPASESSDFGEPGMSSGVRSGKMKAPEKSSNGDDPIGKLDGVLGEIRLKRAFAPTWNQVYTNAELFEGDQVYGGSISSAKVTYYRNGDVINLSGYSLLRISQAPPEKSTYPRDDDKNKPFVPPPGPPQFAHLMKNKTIENPKLSKKEIEELRRKSMAKDKIVILRPVGNLMLVAMSYPTPLAIRLEKIWDQTRLWAYLWDRSNPAAPIWAGTSNGSFSAILIPKPGVYSLLIQSEDGRAESRTMEIAASLREGKKISVLGFENDINKDITVVYQ
jgi:hypothetical protein